MRYYIAYKYTRNKNREQLKKKLDKISKNLKRQGHKTFVLGRDVKKWQHVNFGSIKLIPMIYKNMANCDVLLAYVDSPAFSKGLFFEAIIATFLGKKRIMFLENGVRSKATKLLFNNVKTAATLDDIS